MPYIITTTTPTGGEPSLAVGTRTRRAVATLDEALDPILESLRELGTCTVCLARLYRDEECVYEIECEQTDAEDVRDVFLAAQAMTEDGGSVGPLPNGTVIEVRHAPGRDGWRELAAATKRVYATGGEREILDAFNAASVR